MCGIAGMVRFTGLAAHERDIGARMAATLRHRGPDASGHYSDTHASLGHRRLSIIDLDGGRQPMANESGTIHVVFNGEIYNHNGLRERLQSQGHRFRTRCDTEVIAHAYESYGETFVDHLIGMFAIALWDSGKRRLLLVRDRMGIKPLYYHRDDERVVFGSELKAVLAAGGIDRRIDHAALNDYLTFGHVPAPRTVFRGVHKLEPGHMLRVTATGASLRQWWDIPIDTDDAAASPASESSDDAWREAFAELLETSVQDRLMSDVPLGAFLSGGVDSSSIVAAMCRRATGPVLTQTVGFDEEDHDERAHARSFAVMLGTDHHEVMVRPDAAQVATELVRRFDEPFADSSAVPTLLLSRAAREHVTVALSGDGGDEMLAGYRRYRFDLAEAALRSLCPAWLRRPTAGVAGWLYPKAAWLPRPLRARQTLQNLACDDITAHLKSVSLYGGTLPRLLLRREFHGVMNDCDPYMRGRELFARYVSPHLLNRLLYVDMKTLMVDDILTKVDRASMAVGLEVRVPLLDHRIVELAARMPPRLKLHDGKGKCVLRATLADWVGEEPARRPKKGFDVPVDAWFRGPLRDMVEDLLLSSRAGCHEWIDPRAMRRAMDDHVRGVRANGPLLWTLLMLEMWSRTRAGDDNQPGLPAHHQETNDNRVLMGAGA